MNEKSILEQALLQVQTLEEAVKANAKGILASTMKQELNDLLKESIEEEEEKVDEQPDSDEETTDDLPVATGDEDGLDNDESDDSDDDTSNDEPAKDIDSLDSDETDFDTMDDMGDFGGNFSDDDEDDEVVDMSNAGDEEVLKVFKAMKPEDGIIVKKDGDEIEFSDGDDEYIIKLDDEMGDEPTSPNFDEISEEFSDDDSEEISEEFSDDDDEEVVYEIELDEDDSNDEEVNEKAKEEEMGESSRTIGNGYHAGIESKTKYMAGNKRDEINEEVSKLRKQNGEYKKALVLFKEKLNEVAVFNANLAYATRLFTESSTTKQEKLNILKRFDSISTLKESKNLYSTIKSELETKKPISESVVEKITSAPSTSSTQVLSESKAYENPQFKRMKDLMTKIK
jgi:hypothetical protein